MHVIYTKAQTMNMVLRYRPIHSENIISMYDNILDDAI